MQRWIPSPPHRPSRWKRVVAVLLVAAVALILEGWAASAQAAPAFFKRCTCGAGRPGYHFTPELTGRESYHRGTVAMSNNGGNGSRFFFVHGTDGLPKYSTIIGAVTDGLPVLDRIAASPRQPVRIIDVLIG